MASLTPKAQRCVNSARLPSAAQGHALAHYNRGNALRGLEQHEEAVASYRASLEAVYDPRFPGPTAEQQASQRWKAHSWRPMQA